MPVKLLALAIALASGVMMAIQGSLNSVLGKITGLWHTAMFVHFTASMVAAGVLLNLRFFSKPEEGFQRLGQAPWYTYIGGLVGVLITYGVVRSIPKVGVAAATTAIIVGQVTTAALVDHWGLFGLDRIPFSWLKAVGFVLLTLGSTLLLL